MRGASKDVLNEIERNLHDAMGVARNVVRDPRLVPGGGACEMAVSRGLRDRSAAIEGWNLPLRVVQPHPVNRGSLCRRCRPPESINSE